VYSNKENVNILTALLVAHGIRHAVVCPGSRNAPIVHNFNECPDITCYPVTDERSAGFYALGMALCKAEPVAVCVTSGTALLNLAPAVAEAYYQHVSLVVISADRPPQWIDQLDGQTLPQPDALGRFVRKAVSLPEPHDDEEYWYCNRLVNEALLASMEIVDSQFGNPVHINIPISEPLFSFTEPKLPDERVLRRIDPLIHTDDLDRIIIDRFLKAERPMIVFGQNSEEISVNIDSISALSNWVVILYESLSPFADCPHFDEVLYAMDETDTLLPDAVIYIGGTIVSKRLRHFLRKHEMWTCVVSVDGQVVDPFMNAACVLKGLETSLLYRLEVASSKREPTDFYRCWNALLAKAGMHAANFEPVYSQMAVVKNLESRLSEFFSQDIPFSIHYANSTAIRLANIYARHYVCCNRGVNGIEGSLSTAAGFSCVTENKVFCVIGDLSFFYDQNALWNQNLRGNFRILLMNNGKGGIFNMLPGLEKSPARDKFVSAEHHTTAEGICRQNHVDYQKATNMEEMEQGIDWLLQTESEHPLLLEVFTDAAEDERVYKSYLETFTIS
jgi:2-succinyl-5-enolpyruvyl-6-hydroxy-3-cyclohexene-1-carboxylate synthase